MPLERSRGIVCVVTGRHRLAPAEATDRQLRALLLQGVAAAEAGADLFQVRENDLPDAILHRLVAELAGAVRGSRMHVLVNDRPDIAIAAGAHGVQLKGSGIGIADAKRIGGPRFLVGASAHDPGEVERASERGADFVIFGTIFPTESKPAGHRCAGVEGLALAAGVSAVPIVAIGGVDAARVEEVARFASGIAAIGWFATTDRDRLANAVRQARSAFDTARPRQHN